MFYDKFLRICKENGISPSRAAEECGINRSNVSNWKANGYTPRSDVLNKIADYFGVSVDYLLGNESPKGPSPAVIMGFRGPGQITVPDKKKSDKRQELLQLLDGLSDEQINVLIQVVQSMK